MMANTNKENKLVLYSFWNSSCAWRVRFALNLKGISYEYKAVNLPKNEQFTEEYERVNPLHLVPALADGDAVVSDSFAILLYLEEKYPQKPLLPSDPQLKALNLQVASIVSSNIQPLQMLSVLKQIEERAGPEAQLDFARHHIEKGLQALEKLLNRFTTRYATEEEVSLLNYPTLSRLYESYKILPEYEASLPKNQPDAVVSA